MSRCFKYDGKGILQRNIRLIEIRTPPAYGALGFSKRNATALINGVFFFNTNEK